MRLQKLVAAEDPQPSVLAQPLSERRIGLDASANAPVTPTVADAVLAAMASGCGNPSSGHQAGERSRMILEDARDALTALLDGVQEEGVTFTSGCTEANNMVLEGLLRERRGTLITTSVEHPSILRPAGRLAAKRIPVRYLPVDDAGRVDLEALETELANADGFVLLSVQAANSETGVLQDLGQVAGLAKRGDVLFHADCAQAFAKLRIALGRGIGPDVVTLSGHKINAPMGIGALAVASDCELALQPLLLGGDQESGRRAGTEAVPLIAGTRRGLPRMGRDQGLRLRADGRTPRHARGSCHAAGAWIVGERRRGVAAAKHLEHDLPGLGRHGARRPARCPWHLGFAGVRLLQPSRGAFPRPDRNGSVGSGRLFHDQALSVAAQHV